MNILVHIFIAWLDQILEASCAYGMALHNYAHSYPMYVSTSYLIVKKLH